MGVITMPEPTADEVGQAEALLGTIPEYRPLVDPTNRGHVFKTGEAARLAHLSDHAIRTYAEKGLFHGAIHFPDTGWRIPYSSLVCFVADQYRRSRNAG
jgi:hypothetical protein